MALAILEIVRILLNLEKIVSDIGRHKVNGGPGELEWSSVVPVQNDLLGKELEAPACHGSNTLHRKTSN